MTVADLPRTDDWAVEDVREGDTQEVNGRQLQKFYVDFVGAPDTYWRRRAGDKPKIGESYYGTISENQYGLQFKKERREGGGSGGSGGGGRMRERPPAEIAGARHAHNLLVASENLERLPARASKSEVAERIGILTEFADSLDRQTAAISEAADGAGEGNPRSTPAPSQAGIHERLDSLLEAAGVNSAAATIIRNYVLEQMTVEEQDAVLARLGNDAMKAGAVNRLKERAEKHHGEPLPTAQTDDDIPF